ncbi:hypothetical protein HID58_087751, partial [Brassica napus]
KLRSFDLDFKKVKTSQPGDEVGTEAEHHSSASDTTTEEDLAFCLIMLSRDKWKQQKNKTIVEEDDETNHEREDYKSSKNRGGRGRFNCETCGRLVFVFCLEVMVNKEASGSSSSPLHKNCIKLFIHQFSLCLAAIVSV